MPKKARQMIDSGSEFCNLMVKKLNVAENVPSICQLAISENNLEKLLNSQP